MVQIVALICWASSRADKSRRMTSTASDRSSPRLKIFRADQCARYVESISSKAASSYDFDVHISFQGPASRLEVCQSIYTNTVSSIWRRTEQSSVLFRAVNMAEQQHFRMFRANEIRHFKRSKHMKTLAIGQCDQFQSPSWRHRSKIEMLRRQLPII